MKGQKITGGSPKANRRLGGRVEREVFTRMLQKPRMPQIQGVKGEAVLRYCEPLRTQEMRHHTAFPKGKKQGDFLKNRNSLLVNT